MPVRRDSRTGHWIFQATVKFADGTRKRVFGTPGIPGPYHDLARTRVGAIEAERRAISEAIHGKPLVAVSALEVPKYKTIREHAAGWVDIYKPESSGSEKRSKRRILENMLLPFFGDMTIEGLKQSDVDRWAASEIRRGMAIKTTNNRLAVLSSLIKYVTGAKSPLRFKLKGPKTKIVSVPRADVERLLVACKDDRYRAVILLATEGGLRAGEIRGLQWTDIKDGQLTIRRQLDRETNLPVPPKHNKTRVVPLSPRIVETLATLKRRGIWIVSCLDGSSLGYDGMLEAVHAIYDRAKVTRPRKAMHCFRHTFGTEMAKLVPLPVLQELMGHESVTTTMEYVDVAPEQKRDAIALVFGARASHAQAD